MVLGVWFWVTRSLFIIAWILLWRFLIEGRWAVQPPDANIGNIWGQLAELFSFLLGLVIVIVWTILELRRKRRR